MLVLYFEERYICSMALAMLHIWYFTWPKSFTYYNQICFLETFVIVYCKINTKENKTWMKDRYYKTVTKLMWALWLFVFLLPQLAQDTKIYLLTQTQYDLWTRKTASQRNFHSDHILLVFGSRERETISLKNDTNQSTLCIIYVF